MCNTFTITQKIYRQINQLNWSLRHQGGSDLNRLDRSLTSDETAPHPDDIIELNAMMDVAANILRELAHEIEMRRIELKRNALQYQLETAAE